MQVTCIIAENGGCSYLSFTPSSALALMFGQLEWTASLSEKASALLRYRCHYVSMYACSHIQTDR